ARGGWEPWSTPRAFPVGWTGGSPPPLAVSFHLEDALDLDSDIAGQRVVPDSAADADASILPEHVLHQLREPVDHLRLVEEVVGAVDHAIDLEQPLDLVERAGHVADGGQCGESDLAWRLRAPLAVERTAQA